MATGDIISAIRYNEIQGKVLNILGAGAGDKGYNQGAASLQVPRGSIVYADNINRLYNDSVKIYAHQNGTLPMSIYQVDNEDQITDVLFTAFENLIATAEASPQRFTVHSSQAVVESAGINSSRTALWGGTATPQSVVHEFTATFSSGTARRAFFNAGGEIRINLSLNHTLSGGDADYAKTNDWKNMLAAIGTIKFNYNSTTATSGGPGSTPSAKGNYQLTTSYQEVYKKIGSGVYVDTPGPSWTNVTTLSGTSSGSITSTDDTRCIAVIDESSSQRSAGMLTKWTNFRTNYPNRVFWLLQPGGASQGPLYEPTALWASDSSATGPIEVNRDGGIVAQASDWFDIAGLGSLPSGTKVALSIDKSGSMTLATVQASYNLFISKCAAAGLIVVDLAMNNEDWITPFDIII